MGTHLVAIFQLTTRGELLVECVAIVTNTRIIQRPDRDWTINGHLQTPRIRPLVHIKQPKLHVMFETNVMLDPHEVMLWSQEMAI
jgi:hypothetical protein